MAGAVTSLCWLDRSMSTWGRHSLLVKYLPNSGANHGLFVYSEGVRSDVQPIISQAQQYGLPMPKQAALPPEAEFSDLLRSSQRVHSGLHQGTMDSRDVDTDTVDQIRDSHPGYGKHEKWMVDESEPLPVRERFR